MVLVVVMVMVVMVLVVKVVVMVVCVVGVSRTLSPSVSGPGLPDNSFIMQLSYTDKWTGWAGLGWLWRDQTWCLDLGG